MAFGILFDEQFLEHHDVRYHPECPERLTAVVGELQTRGLWERAQLLKGREATLEELKANHADAYVDAALEHMKRAPGRFDADTFFSEGSRSAALLAAGGTVDLVQEVVERRLDFGFALPRPPGHHATPTRAMGFCIFNNLAIAAHAALAGGQVERILVYDWDLHHGNGTQASFFADDRLLYISAHQWPFFPGSGLNDEIGEGAGEGYSVNVPWPPGAGNEEYCFLIREVVTPLAQEYRPQLILVSAGFDTHSEDLLGSMRVDENGYAAQTRLMADLARQHCEGRIAYVLEGGYNLEAEARGVATVFETMLGDEVEIPEGRPRQMHREIVDRTRKALAPHWKAIF